MQATTQAHRCDFGWNLAQIFLPSALPPSPAHHLFSLTFPKVSFVIEPFVSRLRFVFTEYVGRLWAGQGFGCCLVDDGDSIGDPNNANINTNDLPIDTNAAFHRWRAPRYQAQKFRGTNSVEPSADIVPSSAGSKASLASSKALKLCNAESPRLKHAIIHPPRATHVE